MEQQHDIDTFSFIDGIDAYELFRDWQEDSGRASIQR